MVRLPQPPKPLRRRRRAVAVTPVPEGWPTWAPVGGNHLGLDGSRARDLIPTSRFPDVVRLLHQGGRPSVPETDGWPSPITPAMTRLSRCDVLERRVSPIATPDRPQAHALLAALTPSSHDAVAEIDGFVGCISPQATRNAATNSWPVIGATAVQTNPDSLPPLAFVRGLSPHDAVELWISGGVSHLWSSTWMIRADPFGEASSSLIAGVAGTTERLRLAGALVLPMGHAWPWPPPCRTCDAQAPGAAVGSTPDRP
jgi:hypothetical protein